MTVARERPHRAVHAGRLSDATMDLLAQSIVDVFVRAIVDAFVRAPR